MLINLFLKNKLKSEDIKMYQSLSSFTVALHSLYAINYLKNLDSVGIFIVTHLMVDLFFTTPEFFVHHMCGIMMGLFVYNHGIINEHRDILYRRFINMEISTIFLILRSYIYILKRYITIRPYSNSRNCLLIIIGNIETINNIVFAASFFKFRIYDYFFKIIIEREINKLFYHYTQFNIISNIHIYSSIYTLYAINIYWFTKILKILYKIKKNV